MSCVIIIIIIIIEFLDETRIVIILLQIMIISAGTPLVSNSFHLAGIQNILNFGINTFWFPVKAEGMTDERGTNADYYY